MTKIPSVQSDNKAAIIDLLVYKFLNAIAALAAKIKGVNAEYKINSEGAPSPQFSLQRIVPKRQLIMDKAKPAIRKSAV